MPRPPVPGCAASIALCGLRTPRGRSGGDRGSGAGGCQASWPGREPRTLSGGGPGPTMGPDDDPPPPAPVGRPARRSRPGRIPAAQHRLRDGRRPGLRRSGMLRGNGRRHPQPGPAGGRGDPLHPGLLRLHRLRPGSSGPDDRQAHGPGGAQGEHRRDPAARRGGHRRRAAPAGGLRHRGLRQVGPGGHRHGGGAREAGLRPLLRILPPDPRPLLLPGLPGGERGEDPAARQPGILRFRARGRLPSLCRSRGRGAAGLRPRPDLPGDPGVHPPQPPSGSLLLLRPVDPAPRPLRVPGGGSRRPGVLWAALVGQGPGDRGDGRPDRPAGGDPAGPARRAGHR